MSTILLFVKSPIFNWWNGATLIACLLVPILILTIARSNERLVAYIPPFCTSIGIFFTFFILFKTLGIDFKYLNLDDKKSLSHIIQQLSSKFSCSLLGIFFSIGWSIIIKIVDGNRENKEKKLVIWKQKEPQELLWELTQSQNQIITAITEEKSIVESVIEQIKNSLETYISTLKEGFADHEKLRESQYSDFMGKIDAIGTFVQDNLQQSFSEFNDLLKGQIERMGSEALADSKANIEAIQKNLSELSKELLENHQASLAETFESIRTTLDNLTPTMTAVVAKLENQTTELKNNADQSIKAIQEGFKGSTDQMIDQFAEKASEMQESFAKITDTISTMDQQVQSASQQVLNNHLQQIENTFKSLEDMQGRSKTILEETTGQFANAVGEYKEVQSSNGEVLNRIAEQIEILNRVQENARQQLDLWSEHAEEVREMRNRVNDIGNVVDQLEGLNAQLRKVLAVSNNNHL